MPPPTQSPNPPSQIRSCMTAVVLFGVFLILAGTLLLLPTGFIGPVFLFGGMFFFAFIGAHYFIWGRWLSRVLAEEAKEEADRLRAP